MQVLVLIELAVDAAPRVRVGQVAHNEQRADKAVVLEQARARAFWRLPVWILESGMGAVAWPNLNAPPKRNIPMSLRQDCLQWRSVNSQAHPRRRVR